MAAKKQTAKAQALGQRGPSQDLHGSAPDTCAVALLFVDVINEFRFPEGEVLAQKALEAAHELSALKQRAEKLGVPCIYVNDNWGRWRSDFRSVVRHCKGPKSRGAEVVKLLEPHSTDYFVLKPKHSGFYQTSLDILLKHLQATTLIIGGFVTESCVSFTAHDAYLRDLNVLIPTDGTASSDDTKKRLALSHLSSNLKIATPRCADIVFEKRAGDVALQLRRAAKASRRK